MNNIDPKKPLDLTWHEQQEKLLKNWAEIASSYRWMHYQAYNIYKKKNLWYMIPLIVMSTVTGTANFAQSSFPAVIRPNVPQIIGAINLISAIMTTIYQFLKISEYMESHRISAINYGKLTRTLTVELNLPVKDRSSGGADCVKVTRTEIDRLIEQSPCIPKHVLTFYEAEWSGKGIAEPEIIIIKPVDIYKDLESKIAVQVAEAGIKFKEIKKNKFINLIESIKSNVSGSPTARKKENLKNELNIIGSSKIVSSLKSAFKNITPTVNYASSIPDTEIYTQEIINLPDLQDFLPVQLVSPDLELDPVSELTVPSVLVLEQIPEQIVPLVLPDSIPEPVSTL